MFWGVPTKAVLQKTSKGLHPFRVAYEIDVLDGFDQTQAKKLDIFSYGVNYGSCGVQLRVGNPQFLVGYKNNLEEYTVNQCTPELPYELVKTYLMTGEDFYVPSVDKCFSHEGDLETDIEGCRVWESSYKNWSTYGRVDLRKYETKWEERVELNSLTRAKPWWKIWSK